MANPDYKLSNGGDLRRLLFSFFVWKGGGVSLLATCLALMMYLFSWVTGAGNSGGSCSARDLTKLTSYL